MISQSLKNLFFKLSMKILYLECLILIILFSNVLVLMLNGIIVWSKNTFLSWNDFKAESNPAVFEDAHTTIRYGFTWTVNSDKIGNQIFYFIENLNLSVEFHPVLSWFRLGKNSESLLKHEQGHFDLGELVKREHLGQLQTKFYGEQFLTRGQNEEQRKQFAKEDSGKMIAQDVVKLQEILSQRQKQYDNETDFGQNRDVQSKYDSLFDSLRL